MYTGLYILLYAVGAVQVAPQDRQPWPDSSFMPIEEAVRIANGACVVRFQIQDVQDRYKDPMQVAVDLQVERCLWGECPPFDLLHLQPQAISMSAPLSELECGTWDGLAAAARREDANAQAVLVYSLVEGQVVVNHVLVPYCDRRQPPIEDLLRVRELELSEDSRRLRESLIDAIIDPHSSPLLWSYALRRLYRLKGSLADRFNLVLHPMIQRLTPPPRRRIGMQEYERLPYAASLITWRDSAPCGPQEAEHSTDHSFALVRFLSALEAGLSPHMAEVSLQAIDWLVQDGLRRSLLTERDSNQARRRVRAVLADPDHAIHRIRPYSRSTINYLLERWLGEPDLMGPYQSSWHDRYAPSVEKAIQVSDSAFLATLEWTDVQTPHPNITHAWGEIFPRTAIWGELPRGPIEIGRFQFLNFGGSHVPTIWDEVRPRREPTRLQVALLTFGAGYEIEFRFLIPPEERNGLPPIEQLLRVRQLESRGDSPDLREDLIDVIIDRESRELLWSYAFRRLYRLEDDPDRRFDLVLHRRIQNETPWFREWGRFDTRLRCAVSLLTEGARASSSDGRLMPSQDALQHVYRRLVEEFIDAPSAYLSVTVIDALQSQTARQAGFTDEQWSEFLMRMRDAIRDPDHPIHGVDAERRDWVNRDLERLLGEPNLLIPQKTSDD